VAAVHKKRVRIGTKRKAVIVAIALLVAGLHFLVGPDYAGPWPGFVRGYLIDILLPFSLFLLAGLIGLRPWTSRAWRAVVIFAAAGCVETRQYLGMEVFGRTFDPVDLVAYAAGIGAAAVLETGVLARMN